MYGPRPTADRLCRSDTSCAIRYPRSPGLMGDARRVRFQAQAASHNLGAHPARIELLTNQEVLSTLVDTPAFHSCGLRIVAYGPHVTKGCAMDTLRQLRERRQLTQEQLAVAAEVSTSTVYHIEAGKVQPRPSIVRRIARALGVSPDDIDLSRAPRDVQGQIQ